MLGSMIPSTEEYVQRAFGGEQLAPVPVAGVTTKVVKYGGGALAVAGGFLLGRFFGGGGQEVKPVQTTTVTPELTARQEQILETAQRMRDMMAKLKAKAEAKAEVKTEPVLAPVYNITAGGDVDIGGTTQVTETTTITHAGISQEAIGQLSQAFQAAQQTPQQITITMPEQKTEATQMDFGILALAAAAIIAVVVIFKGGKKK